MGTNTTVPEGEENDDGSCVHTCPECQSIDVVQYGKQANGTQRYRCNNRDCPRTIFLLQYSDKGRLPAVKQQSVDMTLDGSGVRDIVRVLGVTVLALGLCELTSAQPLPEGNNGIAARYPGDVGIGSDPAVIFADDFESYGNAASLPGKWNKAYYTQNIRIARESGNVYSGQQALEFTVPQRAMK